MHRPQRDIRSLQHKMLSACPIGCRHGRYSGPKGCTHERMCCRQAMVFKKKQSAVDEQIAEIDKLNAVINAAERDMLKLRKVCRSRYAAV